MSGRLIQHDSVDQSTVIRIIDDTTGLPEEAVEHNSTGIALWYRREGAAKVAITPAALAALTTSHADGGIEHIDDGYYRLDLPDAAVASGAVGVQVGGTVTGMVVIGTYHELVEFNPALGVAGTSGVVVVNSPVSADGTTLEIIAGDDYSATDSRALEWTDGGTYSLSLSDTISFKLLSQTGTVVLTKAGSVVNTSTRLIRVELAASDTDTEVTEGTYQFTVDITLNGTSRTFAIVRGVAHVLRNY